MTHVHHIDGNLHNNDPDNLRLAGESESSKPESLFLYGRRVHAADYEKLKKIANLLTGLSPTTMGRKQAQALAVQIAQESVNDYRRCCDMPD